MAAKKDETPAAGQATPAVNGGDPPVSEAQWRAEVVELKKAISDLRTEIAESSGKTAAELKAQLGALQEALRLAQGEIDRLAKETLTPAGGATGSGPAKPPTSPSPSPQPEPPEEPKTAQTLASKIGWI
jgi:hypothetical protein